jgi:hypothetical protein
MMMKATTKNTLLFAGIFILLFSLLPVIAFADEGDESDDGDTANTDFPCNPAVETMLLAMGLEDDCQAFYDLGVSPDQFMKAWRLATMLEEDPEAASAIWQDLLGLKTDLGYGWGQIKMAYYLGEDVVGATELLATYRSGEEKVGWGQLKKAEALVDSGLYSSFDAAVTDLETLGWDEIKPDDYTGPPPWSHGKGNDDADSSDLTSQGRKDNPGKKDKDNENGPPYGNAHGRNKDKPDKGDNNGDS